MYRHINNFGISITLSKKGVNFMSNAPEALADPAGQCWPLTANSSRFTSLTLPSFWVTSPHQLRPPKKIPADAHVNFYITSRTYHLGEASTLVLNLYTIKRLNLPQNYMGQKLKWVQVIE